MTQKAIAEELGISQFTVSEALRATSNVSEETRELVMKTARRLGYRVNASARAVVTGRFNAAALLRISDEREIWLPVDMLNGVEETLEDRGMHLLTARVPRELLEDEEYVPRILGQWAVDGVVVHCVFDEPTRLPELLQRYRIPAVWVNAKREADCVYPDDVEAGAEATRRLLGLGHRRIAYVPAYREHHFSSADRLEGYLRAMRTAGAGAGAMVVDRSDEPDRRDPQTRMRLRAMLRAKRVTGVVCYSMPETQIAMMACVEEGLAVPGKVSVVCCAADYMAMSEDVLAVTTLELPWRQIGHRAAGMLLEKIEKPGRAIAPVVLASQWREGLTVGAARND